MKLELDPWGLLAAAVLGAVGYVVTWLWLEARDRLRRWRRG